MNISIIIPALNEAEHIRGFIENILKKEPKNKEIIVVDGGSTDGTKNIASNLGCKVIEEKPHPKKGKCVANAKNQGVQESSGDIICFLEADQDSVEVGFFEQILGAFEDDDVIGVTWENEMVEDTAVESISRRFKEANLTMMRKEQELLVMAVRKELFEEIGGVPLVGYGEDKAFSDKVKELDGEVEVIDPKARYHKAHTSRELLSQAVWLGRTSGDLFQDAKYIGLLGSLLVFLPALFIFPIFSIPYSARLLSLAYLSVTRDKKFLGVPLVDLIYPVGYLKGRISEGGLGG